MKYQLKHGKIDIHLDETYNDKTLADFFDYYVQSKKNRYLLLHENKILINKKKPENENDVLHTKDIITISLPYEQVDYEPSDRECKVVYEDDFVYVVHKEPGIIIHGDEECLAKQAARYQINHNICAPVRYIHRLDEDTTGLVLFVKIPFFQAYFDKMLAEKTIHRHYLAICTGKAKINQRFNWNEPIGRDRHVNGKYRLSKTGLSASTKAKCLARKDDYLLMECELETGRTHQIRVHMSSSNHPIVNDPLYGIPSLDFKHMCLWANKITFKNPVTNVECVAEDIPNRDFAIFKKYIK